LRLGYVDKQNLYWSSRPTLGEEIASLVLDQVPVARRLCEEHVEVIPAFLDRTHLTGNIVDNVRIYGSEIVVRMNDANARTRVGTEASSKTKC
jgi:hypothetical protein